MLKLAKFGGVTFGAGAIIGLSIAGWMYFHRSSNVASVSENENATEPLIDSSTGSGDNTTKISPGSPAKAMALGVTTDGNQGSVLGDSSSGQSYAAATPTPMPTQSSSSLPGPSGFSVYNQYVNASTALFQDVLPGTGKAIGEGSVATVQYRGYLTNGDEFDESYARGKPFTFTEGAGTVIPGWEQGLYGMKAGGQRRLIVPPSQGYGDTAKGSIPADSVLVFDIVLVSVQ